VFYVAQKKYDGKKTDFKWRKRRNRLPLSLKVGNDLFPHAGGNAFFLITEAGDEDIIAEDVDESGIP
jgi:hypothetical protein